MESHRPYATARYEKFCLEIEENTFFEVEHYQGRWFYEGPAVRIEADELQDVIRATSIKLQWDELGKTGLIVYPR